MLNEFRIQHSPFSIQHSSSPLQLLTKSSRKIRPLPLILMLEKHVRLLPPLPFHPIRPPGEVGVGVFGTAKAEIAPGGGGNHKSVSVCLVGIGEAERGVAAAQQ